mgnify:CR=1 FL=1
MYHYHSESIKMQGGEKMQERLSWSIDQLAHALGVGYVTVWRLVRRGQIRAIRISRLWRIPAEEAQRVLHEGTKRKEG